jgi:hypothetical protein
MEDVVDRARPGRPGGQVQSKATSHLTTNYPNVDRSSSPLASIARPSVRTAVHSATRTAGAIWPLRNSGPESGASCLTSTKELRTSAYFTQGPTKC